ncbi:putative subtilisin [Colletotrichum sojae]|uniref:Putative subtilisin n=1 Tax=Colletotrichum sojae TaxID=2175907 RepID=A0A8H6ISS5_9PEZI|nr:putative subtilisin [Colletotrichum sojae]
MSADFAVGFGAGGDSADPLDFAKEALSRVSQIAVDLGARKKLCFAGCLAAELLIARKALEAADVSQLPKLQRRVPKLLDDLERVCVWPYNPEPYNATLRSLAGSKGKGTDERVRQGILSFSKSSPKIIEQYFQKLERFSKQVVQLPDENLRGGEKAKQLAKDIKEYPAHVYANLYAVLKSHSLCTCRTGHSSGFERHQARLRLRNELSEVDGHVAFDMLFSASPASLDHWQNLQLHVSLRNKTAKAVKFGDEPDPLSCLKRPAKTRVVKPEEFCGLIKTKWASRICCRVQDSELHQLYDGLPLVENVDSGPSKSLRRLLEIGRLSNRMKMVLAFIVARSFWQYYDSPWMDSPWSSDSIHFLPELVVEDEHDQPSVALYASKPYFAVQFLQHAGESVEYCSAFGVVYRYPRLLALCIILLEIGRGQSLTTEDHGSVEANLNANWTLAKRLTNKNRTWGDFDYPHYRQAILGCLNYNYSKQAGASIETNVFARKAAVYEAVLQPLEKLVNELGFAENMNIMDPIDASQGPGRIADVPAPPAMPMRNSAVDQTSQWLNDLNAINRYFHKRCPLASVPSPRVAILDTGFDEEGVFFSVPGRRQKVKGWKDFAADSELPVDDNGHGSHCTALIMKVAPHATIYVARIAKDRGSLRNAAQAIADAIDWAAHEVKADIVSMSFGFKDEVPVITQAITRAMLERHGKIIFLAAASNSGGNRREMFPANLDSVISIRETNTLGAFSDTNPPVDPDGPAVLGTLGRDVPSAWLSSVEGEVAKSGSSVATAIAAGIAAMMITIMSIGMADTTVQISPDTKKLWTKRGMRNAMARMSFDMGNRSYYISPAGFFSGKGAEKAWAAIADACTR